MSVHLHVCLSCTSIALRWTECCWDVMQKIPGHNCRTEVFAFWILLFTFFFMPFCQLSVSCNRKCLQAPLQQSCPFSLGKLGTVLGVQHFIPRGSLCTFTMNSAVWGGTKDLRRSLLSDMILPCWACPWKPTCSAKDRALCRRKYD